MARQLRKVGWLCCLLILVVFHQQLLVLASRVAIYFYSIHQLGEPLKYNDIKIEDRALVIYQPHSKKFSADRIGIKLAVNWKAHQLELSLNLDKPLWNIEPSKIKEASWKSWLQREGSWVKVNTLIKVRDGMAKGGPSNREEGTLHFNLDASSQLGGYLEGWLGQSNSGQNHFTLWAFNSPEALYIDWSCQELNCASALHFLSSLFPKLPLGSISSGNLEGHLTAIFPMAQKPHLNGELFLDNLQFVHQFGLQGTVEKAKIKIEPSTRVLSGGVEDYTTIGSFEILKSSSLSYSLNAQEAWRLKDVTGSIRLDPSKLAFIDLQAAGMHQEQQSHFKIKGEANLNPRSSLHLNLDLACLSANHPEGHIQVLVYQTYNLNKLAEVRFKSLSYVEWGFLQTMLSAYWPSIAQIEFQEGILDALISAEISQGGISQLKCHNFQAEKLKFTFAPWQALFDFPKWTGHGAIDLSQADIQKSLNGEIHIEEGKVAWAAAPAYVLSDIQTRLLINEGWIHHSLVKLQFAGLKGVVDIEWGTNSKLLTINLEGKAQELAELFPTSLQPGIYQEFQDHQIGIAANVKGFPNDFDVNGTLHVERYPKANQFDLIHFGFDLKKAVENGTPSIKPSGWFYAKQMPLKKFVSPFIFRHGSFSLTGVGEFKGFFDADRLEIKYGIGTFKIENKNFAFEFDFPSPTRSDSLIGLHEFNFRTYAHHGTFPLSHARYIEKNTGILIEDIQSQVVFRDQTVDFLSLESVCNGICLNGDLHLDYSHLGPGRFSVDLRLPSINGKVSRLRHLLSMLNTPIALAEVPLEGDLQSTGKGCVCKLDFIPNDYTMQMAFQGHISHGTLPLHEKYLSLQDVHMDINYEHDQQQLELTHIQGALLAGKPAQGKECEILGRYIIFKDLKYPQVALDLEMNYLGCQLARLVAHAHTSPNSFIDVVVDQQLSHLCHIHPKQFDLTMQGWMHPHVFQFKADFHLDGIWQQVQLLSHPVLSLLNPSLLDRIQQVKDGKGYFNAFINYYHSENQWDYNLKGEKISFNDVTFHRMALKGKKANSKWTVDQFELDDLSIYADVHHEMNKWKIDFLGLKYGEGLLMGLAGEWNEGTPFIEAKVQLLEVQLAPLADYPLLRSFMNDWHFDGLVKGKGDLKVEWLNDAPWVRCNTEIQSQAPHQIVLNGSPIEIAQPISFQFVSNQHFIVKGIEAKVYKDHQELLNLGIDEVCYRLPEDQLECAKMSFNIPRSTLNDLAEILHQTFSTYFNENIRKDIISLSLEGPLKGWLSLKRTPLSYTLKMALEDGIYQFKHHLYDLKDLCLDICPHQLTFSGALRQEQQLLYVSGQASWPNLEEGKIILKDSLEQPTPLQITWLDSPETGWYIQAMEGEVYGINFLLMQAADTPSDSWTVLNGKLELDLDLMSPLLKESFPKKMQELEIGSRYTLNGTYWLNGNSRDPLLEKIYFEGHVYSKEALLKGYQVESLEASVNYYPNYVEIKNLKAQDPAGQIHCPEMAISYQAQEKKWWLSVPRLMVKNLKPSLLRPVKNGQDPFYLKNLLIRRIELQDFSGELDHVNSWQAYGTVHFLNPSRKNLSHPLLAIPAEIVLQLGLDPNVLNPVTGTIYFTLQGERFYLTKFKDVYSEGRGSKFYLADGPQPSWMDMEGNLSVQIKMKQYNLIFKLAELFTVSIQGNIKKPKYGLQKYEKNSRKKQVLPFTS